ncbi:MAG: hypothetical protein AB1896_01700 [Thermodesulfobacteriota bacterium]
MNKPEPAARSSTAITWRNLSKLSSRLLQAAIKGSPKAVFLGELLFILKKFSQYEDALLWLPNGEAHRCSKALEADSYSPDQENTVSSHFQPDSRATDRLFYFLRNRPMIPAAYFSEGGSFWTNQARSLTAYRGSLEGLDVLLDSVGPGSQSIALIPLDLQEDGPALLQLCAGPPALLTREIINFFEEIGQVLGMAFFSWRNSWTLHERVKEMSCLYSITQVIYSPEKSWEDLLRESLVLIPPAWQYPDLAYARITFDDQVYSTPEFPEGRPKQTAEFMVNGQVRGSIQVTYSQDRPVLDEGPFLKEERKLLDTIAQELSATMERKLLEKEKAA